MPHSDLQYGEGSLLTLLHKESLDYQYCVFYKFIFAHDTRRVISHPEADKHRPVVWSRAETLLGNRGKKMNGWKVISIFYAEGELFCFILWGLNVKWSHLIQKCS